MVQSGGSMKVVQVVRAWARGIVWRGFVSVGLPLLLVCAASSARGAESPDEALIRQGIEARKKGDDDSALDLFRKAYEMKNTPRAAAQMGLAEMALGRWVDAEAHVQEAMAAPNDAWVRKNRATLQSVLDATGKQLGSLEVRGSPAGAEVVIDRATRGTLPLGKPLRVRAGDVRIEVRAPGFDTTSRVVQVSPSQLSREVVELVSSQPVAERKTERKTERTTTAATASDAGATTVAASGGSASGASTAGSGSEGGGGTAGDQGDSSSKMSRLRVAGIVLAGAGVASLVTGMVFGAKAKAAGDANSQVGGTFSDARESDGRRYQTLQFVGYGLGAALIAGGVVAWIKGGPETADGGSVASFTPLPGGAMAGWRASF